MQNLCYPHLPVTFIILVTFYVPEGLLCHLRHLVELLPACYSYASEERQKGEVLKASKKSPAESDGL